MTRLTLTTLVLVLGLALVIRTTHGAEIGHYGPGLPNIRDFVVPQPGFTACSITISTRPTASTTATVMR